MNKNIIIDGYQLRFKLIAFGLHEDTHVVHPVQKLLSMISATFLPFFSIIL